MVKERPDISRVARFNRKEAAELLGCSVETIRRMVNAGLLRQRFCSKSPRPYYLGADLIKTWDEAWR